MANDEDFTASRHLRLLFGGGATGIRSDGELLQQFAAGTGEAAEFAFAALVDRHGPMVRRVARAILRDAHHADDAFQATFFVLSRKAGSLRVTGSLGPWLHGVTCRVASCLRSAESRRRRKERLAGEKAPTAVTDRTGDDLGPALHEEIHSLPDRFRTAVVLCLLQGLTQEQAAQRLGWPPGTVRSRLARGRSLLQGRLVRRGLAPAAALLSATGAADALAVPSAESLARAVLAYRSGTSSAGFFSPRAIEVSSHVLRSLSMTRFKVAAMLVVTLTAGVTGFRVFALQNDDEPAPAARAAPAAKAAPAAEAAPAARPAPVARPQMNVPGWRWRYRSVRLLRESQIEEKANEESAKGWELFQVVPVLGGVAGNLQSQYTLVLRRPAEADD